MTDEIDSIIAANGNYNKVLKDTDAYNIYSNNETFTEDDYTSYAQDLSKLKASLISIFGEANKDASNNTYYLIVSAQKLLPVLSCIDERKSA